MYVVAKLVSLAIAYCTVVALIERGFTLFIRLYRSKPQRKSTTHVTPPSGSNKVTRTVTQAAITPLPTFDYKKEDPIGYRPYRTKRHVTMGISKSTKQEWIRIDNKYQDRINYRTKLVKEQPDVCIGTSETGNPGVRDLYQEVILDLLPKRYPTMFRIEGDIFFNLVTGRSHGISHALTDPPTMLRQLAENVEEDFYLMCPNAEGEFYLESFVSCFPQGLLPPAKAGMSVSQIHEPVPGYEGRLKNGVNRCFQRMARGQSIGRLNWAIQINNDELFLPYDGANTLKSDDSPSCKVEIDPRSSYLRVEHHTLSCLPRTGMIFFAVRSYMTPLTVIKAEGCGPELADACDSMPEKFGIYKNRPTWGEQLGAWLREGGSTS